MSERDTNVTFEPRGLFPLVLRRWSVLYLGPAVGSWKAEKD